VKKLLLTLTLGLVAFVLVERQRVYVWDPLATVTRDGVKQEHVRAMINFSNDIFLEDASAAPARMYVVQRWNMAAVRPAASGFEGCIQYLACWMSADHVSGDAIASRGSAVRFENDRWEFVDERGAVVVVKLR
jgi:hypothetical protein